METACIHSRKAPLVPEEHMSTNKKYKQHSQESIDRSYCLGKKSSSDCLPKQTKSSGICGSAKKFLSGPLRRPESRQSCQENPAQ